MGLRFRVVGDGGLGMYRHRDFKRRALRFFNPLTNTMLSSVAILRCSYCYYSLLSMLWELKRKLLKMCVSAACS